MNFLSIIKSIWKDFKKHKVAVFLISVVSILANLISIYGFINKKWPGITWTNIIIIVLSMLLGFCLYLLYEKYKENNKKDDNNKEEFGQIILKHESFKNWDKIRNAQNQIILHAAFYPNYITPPYRDAIDDLLANQDKLKVKITVIITHPSVGWADEFKKILRDEYNDIKSFKAAIRGSSDFFLDRKKKQDDNNRINIILSKRLPLFPVVIIDDELFIGHYCHSDTPAPLGFWIYKKDDAIPQLIDSIIGDTNNPNSKSVRPSDTKLKALARYIEDIKDAIINGKKITSEEELEAEMDLDNPNENTEEIKNNQNM